MFLGFHWYEVLAIIFAILVLARGLVHYFPEIFGSVLFDRKEKE